MNEQGKLITRQEIYEAVWTKPIKTLVQEWNTSPAQVVRACEEMKVPRPAPGHWQMIARGYDIQREPLVEPTEEVAAEAVLLPPAETAKAQRRKIQQPTRGAARSEQ